jgi:hypothetical protein
MRRLPRVWHLAVPAGCGLVLACVAPAPAPRPADLAAAPRACASEAELLAQPVEIYALPRRGLRPMAELSDGDFIYRCERRGEWLAIMFPDPGEAVDCSVRSAGNACAVGWIHGDPETMVMG